MRTELGFPTVAPPLLGCPWLPSPLLRALSTQGPCALGVSWVQAPLFWGRRWDACLVVKLGSAETRGPGVGGDEVSSGSPCRRTAPPGRQACPQAAGVSRETLLFVSTPLVALTN